MKADIFELIDNKPEDVKCKANNFQQLRLRELRNNINAIVHSELSKVSDTANRKIKNLDGVNIQPISFGNSINLNNDIDFTGALEELDINIEDVLGWATKTAGTAAAGALLGSVIPGVGNLIGAIAGGVIGGVAHALSGDGGKADARKSVSDAIGEAKQRAKRNIIATLKPTLNEIDGQKRQLRNSIKAELANIDSLQDTLDRFGEEINDYVNVIKHKHYGRI